MDVDVHVWQFNVDYPGLGGSDDSKLPLRSVNVKAWDEVYWMSNFDRHAAAISGPAQIAKLVNIYKAQGLELLLWCVPKGRNVAAMLSLSKQCIDVAGVKGLIFDVEPFSGFCAGDCSYLASTLMQQVRVARPNAWLGTTYDPRQQHWGPSGTTEWLKHSNAALPMVYFDTFAGQGAWGDPNDSVRKAHSDLRGSLAPGRNIEYFPILQGAASAARMTEALGAVKAVGSKRASLWRRGVVQPAAWSAIAAVAEPAPPPPPIPPPPPVDPCLDVKRQLSACQAQVNRLQATIATKDADIARRDEQITSLQQQIAGLETDLQTCQAKGLETQKFVEAIEIVKEYIASL